MVCLSRLLLQREFAPTAPNTAWVSDITYLRTLGGWMYLAVIIDLYSRRVASWSLKKNMTARIVCDALEMAVRNRRPPIGIIFHSDQGSQYLSKRFKKQLSDVGAIQSMSRRGNCWDNAVAESFFATFKKELVRGVSLMNFDAAKGPIFRYIEVFYNRKRKHSFISGVSPAEFEACQYQQQAA